MTTGPEHPQATEVLEQLARFNSVLEDQVNRASGETYSATDETKTVNATVDGQRLLTGLYIEEGSLRLGAETVAQRINDALTRAQVASSAATEAQYKQLYTSLSQIADSIQTTLKQP